MTLAYLPEHAENALLALNLAKKEATHLAYTHRTLYAQHMDLEWVRNLSQRDDLAEKIDAFVSRFGRLQDHIGDKLNSAICRSAWRHANILAGQPCLCRKSRMVGKHRIIH